MRPISILTYHNIDQAPVTAEFSSLYVSPRAFARQMACLRALGYRGVSMTEGLPYLQGERQGRIAVLSFDDGYRDNLEHALPVLLNFGFTATCYVVVQEIGRHNAWDDGVIGVRKRLMDAGEIRAWLAGGMEIGSHSLSHPRLSKLTSMQKRLEIVDSKQALEDHFGVRIEHFCYPYGDFDDECASIVRSAGYRSAVTTQRGRESASGDLFRLRRVGISGNRNLLQFVGRLLTSYEDLRAGRAA